MPRRRRYALPHRAEVAILLEWETRGNGDELAVDISADGECGYLRITGMGARRTFDEQDGVPSMRVHTMVADFLLGGS